MNSFPSCITDSEEIRILRRKYQKTWSKEEFWAFYIMRPISIYISHFIARQTNVTPNTITLCGIFLGLAASACFMTGSGVSILIGVLLYQLGYLMDCVDGEVARMINQKSKAGVWFDIGLNYSQSLSFFAVVFGLFKDSPPLVTAFLLYVTLFSILSYILVSEGASSTFGKSASDITASMRKKSRLLDMIIFLFLTEKGFQFGLFILSLLWMISGLKYPIMLWTLIYLLFSLLKAIYKLKLSTRYFKI